MASGFGPDASPLRDGRWSEAPGAGVGTIDGDHDETSGAPPRASREDPSRASDGVGDASVVGVGTGDAVGPDSPNDTGVVPEPIAA